MRLSAVMVSSWRAGKLSSDRAGASASRPKSLSLDVHLDVTLRAKIHDLPGVSSLECLWTCANPELIDAGSVVARLVSGTDSYGSLGEAKRSRAAEVRYQLIFWPNANLDPSPHPGARPHDPKSRVSMDLRESGANRCRVCGRVKLYPKVFVNLS